ncbi:MAG: L-rhamnose mutarotase [Phycisphaerae bacterium]|nr:L-rhamnose mutarotase [Phycisphaerae bacterium]
MRICFHLRVRPDRIDEYRRLHRAVWPEMLAALKSAGIRAYSIHMWTDGPEPGHEFGFLECDDWEEVKRRLAADPVVARWESHMAAFLVTPVGPAGPALLEEVFRLD